MSREDKNILIKIIILAIIILVSIGFSVWVMKTYGNKTIDEVPMWVIWLMRK